jgi:DNA-binding transcriptional ArsR family regulator
MYQVGRTDRLLTNRYWRIIKLGVGYRGRDLKFVALLPNLFIEVTRNRVIWCGPMSEKDRRDDEDGEISALELGSELQDPLEDLSDDDPTIEGFGDDESDTLAQDKVRRAVRKFGEDGITVSEIMEVTGLARNTVDKHLTRLRQLREVYRQKRDKQTYFYYPNGKPLHSFGKKRIEDGDTILDIQLAKGKNDDLYFHLTEKRFSLMEGETTEGAVIFPMSSLDEVFQKMQEFAEEAEE